METFKELLDTFENFNADTDAKLLELGKAHKSLPVRERN